MAIFAGWLAESFGGQAFPGARQGEFMIVVDAPRPSERQFWYLREEFFRKNSNLHLSQWRPTLMVWHRGEWKYDPKLMLQELGKLGFDLVKYRPPHDDDDDGHDYEH